MLNRFLTSLFARQIDERVRARLAAYPETDDTIYIGSKSASAIFQDRFNYDRQTILKEALLAWRTNPIAKRIVELTTEFVIGDGIKFQCEHKASHNFLTDLWRHPLNKLDTQLPEWSDELTRTGDLFLLCSADAAGMLYIRAVPSELIEEIQTQNNDYRQETFYLANNIDTPPYPAYDPNAQQNLFMLHYCVNRPVGVSFGESDLYPILKWLQRLSTLVNDRVIMQHLRNLVVYLVSGKYSAEPQREARQRSLNSNPPQSGSVVVAPENETWSVLSPNMQSSDAERDILAVKRMIAAGVGLPLHYLAEPESSTRTTAEAAGMPTFRRFRARQNVFSLVIKDVLTVALAVRKTVDKRVQPAAPLTIIPDDITERDNSILALAAARIEPVLADMFDRHLIDESQYLFIFYQLLGMDYDTSQPTPAGIRAAIRAPGGAASRPSDTQVQPGEEEEESPE